ncbi:KpsF/GutQ family sugar-phosphate isomerase [Bdellovibrionota bacterium FG-2]
MSGAEVAKEVRRVLELEAHSILECRSRIEGQSAREIESALGCLKNALENGGKIVVTGLGKSGKVAQKVAATLSSTGSLAVFLHPTEGLHGDLGVVSSKDAVLAISYTGNTEELIRLLPSLRNIGAKIVGLCGNSQSRLRDFCDHFIEASVSQEACPHNLAPTSSSTLALAMGDALAVTLMQLRGFDADAFAKIHPAGSLGYRLNLRVEEIMHSGDQLGLVGPHALMEEVIGESTRKKLGGVLVVEGTKLLGIITDGDIRRALQHREKFFSFEAQQVMTSHPITVVSSALAKVALDLMENRSSQISVIPVVGEDGSWKGLVRLHDLVRTF